MQIILEIIQKCFLPFLFLINLVGNCRPHNYKYLLVDFKIILQFFLQARMLSKVVLLAIMFHSVIIFSV